MPWYDDPTRTEFLANYSTVKQLERDLEQASRRGWTLLPSRAAQTASGGGSNISVSFIRSPEWMAERERELAEKFLHSAARAADDQQAKVVRNQDALARAEERLVSRLVRPVGASATPQEKFEKEVLEALKEVVAKRRSFLATLDGAVEAMSSALTLGASEFSATLARYQRAQGLGKVRLESEIRTLREQEALVRKAKRWDEAEARRRKSSEEFTKREAEFQRCDGELSEQKEVRDEALAALPPADA